MKTFNFPKTARVAAVNAVLAWVAMVYTMVVIYTFMNPNRILAILEAHPLAAFAHVPFVLLFPFTAVVLNDIVSKDKA